MMLYKPIAWKADEECDFAPTISYENAKALGNEFYPSGYNIEEIDTDDIDE